MGLNFDQKSSSLIEGIKQAVIVELNFNQKSVIVRLNINKIDELRLSLVHKSGIY